MANRKIAVRTAAAEGTWYGALIMAVVLMGFGVWGNMAPIAGAVVASGVFVVTGQNKIVQHLEGGMIREIYVREGDTVAAGQMLLELDDTAARAELQRLFLRRIRLTAIDARLQAEMREEKEITLPPEIVQSLANSPEVKEIVDSQQMAFTARRNNLNSDVKSIQESISALEERIRGSRVQLDAVHRQIVLLDEEIVTKDKLVQAGLVRKPELIGAAAPEGQSGRRGRPHHGRHRRRQGTYRPRGRADQ